MRVLFVSAGTRGGMPAEVVKNQADALKSEGVELEHFCIGRGGLWGYIRAIPRLRREIKLLRPDVVHAHYSLSAFIAALSGFRPVVASIMGSETSGSLPHRLLIRLFIKLFWTETVVKSRAMAFQLKTDDVYVIPNGVNIARFRPMNREEAITGTTLERRKTNIIFVSNPDRQEKNWQLAVKAVASLSYENIKLTAVYNVSNRDLVYYYNSASLLLLTSLREGSPNVIKEAMACNCPIVSTDVGDVRSVLGTTEGTYITSFDHKDIAEKLSDAIKFAEIKGRTNGRDRIIETGLDSKSVSEKLISIYMSVIKKQK
jgi:teichuronic acid biosynthesis glycosyltransferase TuaC